MKHSAKYSVNFGLVGCYMPDSYSGAFECTTRKQLADAIRDELLRYDMPAYLFSDVRIKRLWQFTAKNGSSCAHFSLIHKGYALRFEGLTEEEYRDAVASENY